jgi:DNA-binding MarR family transcriptional regulator
MSARQASKLAVDDLSALINCLVSLGNRVSNGGSTAMASLNLGFVEARIVHAVGQQGGRHSAAIAKELGVDPGAFSRNLKALRETGVIHMDSLRRLALTEEGRKLYASVSAILIERHQRLLSALTIRESIQLLDYLRRLLTTLPALSEAPLLTEVGSDTPPLHPTQLEPKRSWRRRSHDTGLNDGRTA